MVARLAPGADLSHVFCDEAAAGPIKSYSPELIVHGCLRGGQGQQGVEAQADAVSAWFPSLTALVVGPGLGRDETLQAVAAAVVERAAAASLPLVIDADGCARRRHRPRARGPTAHAPPPAQAARRAGPALARARLRVGGAHAQSARVREAAAGARPTHARSGRRVCRRRPSARPWQAFGGAAADGGAGGASEEACRACARAPSSCVGRLTWRAPRRRSCCA